MSFCPMSWAAVGRAGVGVWPGVGRGVAIGVGAGVTFVVAAGEGESVGSRVTSGVAVGVGEPVGAVVDPRAVSDGDADGVLEQPARSRTSRKTPDRFMVFGLRSSSSLNDGAAGPRVMPHAGPD
jgi:hypothetical protein